MEIRSNRGTYFVSGFARDIVVFVFVQKKRLVTLLAFSEFLSLASVACERIIVVNKGCW